MTSLRGPLLHLREVDEDDAGEILRLRRSERVHGKLHPIVVSLERQRSWIREQRLAEGDHYFTIRRNTDLRTVGLVALYDINRERRTAEWGRWVIEAGVPAAPESALLVLTFGFEVLELQSIVTRTVATNLSVVGFHESYGATRSRLLSGHFDVGDGPVDAVEHIVTLSSWPDVRSKLHRASERISRSITRRNSHSFRGDEHQEEE